MDAATDEHGAPPPSPEGEPDPSASPPAEDLLNQHSSLPIETIIYYLYNNGLSLVAQYGWYILLAVVLLAIGWLRLKPHYYQWKRKREEQIDEQNFDPVKAERYQEAMLEARERMQRDLNEKSTQHQENKEKREDEERDERIKQWEEFKVVSTSKKPKPKDNPGGWKPPPRRDYYPLSGGGGGGSGYRPPRRMAGRGG